eukprot:TRINITY_DN5573_c0_g1_i3.p2 TRINITY_DN5573_c0_g1~~TRINITY_DN5573_c0_g1_i3.p2  ORF type:complete len:190 (+),score=38.27 TRINITY_DN5573_c0_g1_i3:39-608(+)
MNHQRGNLIKKLNRIDFNLNKMQSHRPQNSPQKPQPTGYSDDYLWYSEATQKAKDLVSQIRKDREIFRSRVSEIGKQKEERAKSLQDLRLREESAEKERTREARRHELEEKRMKFIGRKRQNSEACIQVQNFLKELNVSSQPLYAKKENEFQLNKQKESNQAHKAYVESHKELFQPVDFEAIKEHSKKS